VVKSGAQGVDPDRIVTFQEGSLVDGQGFSQGRPALLGGSLAGPAAQILKAFGVELEGTSGFMAYIPRILVTGSGKVDEVSRRVRRRRDSVLCKVLRERLSNSGQTVAQR